MSDDEDRPTILYDSEPAAASEHEDEQRRGRERMLSMWRNAVRSAVDVAGRQPATAGAPPPAAYPGDEDEGGDADQPADTVETWVFPDRPASPSGN